jgi:hypothetical protein
LIKNIKQSWGLTDLEIALAKLPKSFEKAPKLCHICFSLVFIGVVSLIMLIIWFIALYFLINIVDIHPNSKLLIGFLAISSIIVLGSFMIIIGYGIAVFYFIFGKGWIHEE